MKNALQTTFEQFSFVFLERSCETGKEPNKVATNSAQCRNIIGVDEFKMGGGQPN